MMCRKTKTRSFHQALLLWGLISQILGVIGALAVGTVLDAGIEGLLIGYALGVALSLGFTFGLV